MIKADGMSKDNVFFAINHDTDRDEYMKLLNRPLKIREERFFRLVESDEDYKDDAPCASDNILILVSPDEGVNLTGRERNHVAEILQSTSLDVYFSCCEDENELLREIAKNHIETVIAAENADPELIAKLKEARDFAFEILDSVPYTSFEYPLGKTFMRLPPEAD